MTFSETVFSPVAQIITHTPIWVWGVFMLLAWLGNRQWRASTLSLQLRQALKEAGTRAKRKPFPCQPRLKAPTGAAPCNSRF